MKWFVLVLSFIGSIANASVGGNCYTPQFELPDMVGKENGNSAYVISVSNEAITLSSLPIGAHVWIFDSSGRNIFNKVAKSNFITAPINSKGVFIIRIKTDKDIYTTKILVK